MSELQDLMNALQQEALVAERVAHPASGEQREGRRNGARVQVVCGCCYENRLQMVWWGRDVWVGKGRVGGVEMCGSLLQCCLLCCFCCCLHRFVVYGTVYRWAVVSCQHRRSEPLRCTLLHIIYRVITSNIPDDDPSLGPTSQPTSPQVGRATFCQPG